MMSNVAQAVLDRAEQQLMGPFALIRMVRPLLNAPGMPRIYSASSVINSITTYNSAEMVGHTGAVGFDVLEAKLGAVGECVERYCCAVYQHHQLVYCSAVELGTEAVGMDQFCLFTQRQLQHDDFPLPIWQPNSPMHWVQGRSLLQQQTKYIPACLTYIPYLNPCEVDRQPDLFALAVSSGQACHSELDAALLSGLCEVIERDAFMICWSKMLSVPRLDYSADPELCDIFERYFACAGLQFHLFDITLDIPIPSVLCVVQGISERGPYCCVGAATRPHYRDAIVKAWQEAAQGLIWAQSLMQSKPDWRPATDFHNVRDFADHVRLFCEPDMQQHMAFLLDTKHSHKPDFSMPQRSTAASLQYCLDVVSQSGFDVISVDLTTDDILSSGLVVHKVFVPGTASLYAVHGLPHFGCPRFEQVPARLGLSALPLGQFNPVPHPFP
jgi:ribosomal protein S12 methylthiotransferase accessory factor